MGGIGGEAAITEATLFLDGVLLWIHSVFLQLFELDGCILRNPSLDRLASQTSSNHAAVDELCLKSRAAIVRVSPEPSQLG